MTAVSELVDAALRLREAGARLVDVSADRVQCTFDGPGASESPLTQTREAMREQEARALLQAEAEESPWR